MHGLLTNENRRIQPPKTFGDPPYPMHYHIFGGTRGGFSKIVVGFRNFAWALITNKNRRIPIQKSIPHTIIYLGGQGGYFQKLSSDSEIFHGLITHKNRRIPTKKKFHVNQGKMRGETFLCALLAWIRRINAINKLTLNFRTC